VAGLGAEDAPGEDKKKGQTKGKDKRGGGKEGKEDDDEDHEDDRGAHFFVELTLEIQSDHGSPLTQTTTSLPITEPFAYIRLPARPTTAGGVRDRETKTFIRTEPWLATLGRGPDGQFIVPGVHPYRVYARFLRSKVKANKHVIKVIGVTPDVVGSILVSRRVDPPSVDPVAVLTNVPVLAMAGTRQTNVAIMINGIERVPLGPSTTWNTTKTLMEGSNSITLTARDAYGTESLPVSVSVTLDTVPPPPPVVSVPPSVTTSRTLTLSGTKEAGTAIILNSAVLVPASSATTWSITVELQERENRLLVESMDEAGNRSLAAGSEIAEVASQKPVIGDLTLSLAEMRLGESATISYRLFAQVPPTDNADLKVRVLIEDGDRIVRTVVSGTQKGDTTGITYSCIWDATDDAGQPVVVNTSYRVVVSAERANPTTMAPHLVGANPQESAIIVIGSQHAASTDGKVQLIFRPDDARVTIAPAPPLSVLAGRMLTARRLKPMGGCYQIRSDRPLATPVVGLYKHGRPDGWLVRPFEWNVTQQDWTPVARCNWNPSTQQVSFALAGPCTVVLAGVDDASPPEVSTPVVTGGRFEVRVLDGGVGLDTDRLRVRQGGQDLTKQVAVRLLNGIHEALLSLGSYDPSRGSVEVYVVDRVGNGRLVVLGTH
jgi:hypothetical protein